MEKLKINLDLLLPDIPDEQDACVHRIIKELSKRKGIERIHIVPKNSNSKAQLCFHYNPQKINVDTIEKLASKAGAQISHRYRHLIYEVGGIRHQRQTKLIESVFRREPGIMSVSVAATGIITLEFDTTIINEERIQKMLNSQGLILTKKNQRSETRHTEILSSPEDKPEDKHDHELEHKHEHAHVHDGHEHHHHGGIFGKNTELIFSILCGIFLGIGFLLDKTTSLPFLLILGFYIGAYFLGGYFTAKEAIQTITRGGFEIDFLMLAAALGAAFLGSWAEGALLLFLFSLGHALEHYAMEKARKSIESLTELTPKTALLKQNEQIIEVGIEHLKKSDIIVVKPDTKIPADGIVIKGSSSVNQAPITGESIPVDKEAFKDVNISPEGASKLEAKYRVFAGTINGNDLLEIKVTKEASDSTLARLVKMVNEAQTQKSPTQQFTDKFEKYFVPIILILVVLLCFSFVIINESFSSSFHRAISVLVAASPCALAISTPSAVLSGVARAAHAGVLIKGGRPLEDLGTLTAIAFDKTGTLTEGNPKVTHIIPLGDITETGLLETAIAVESLSDHPIAKAVVRDGTQMLNKAITIRAHDLQSAHGKGLRAILGDDEIYAGNMVLFDSLNDQSAPDGEIRKQITALEQAGNTTLLFRRNRDYIGIISLMDTPRAEAAGTLEELKKIGIQKMIMLTGDNQEAANTIAAEIGITKALGNLLPEEKVAAIEKIIREENKVAMVGDGVNDAPAMAKSTVGIAMGAAGSDVALETADIALMGDQLSLLPFAIRLSRKAKSIIKQNLWISLGMVTLLIPLTMFDIASIGPAVIAHEGSTLVVVLNALRLLGFRP